VAPGADSFLFPLEKNRPCAFKTLRTEQGAEFLLGAVDQHAQIVACDAKTSADFVLWLLFKEDRPQYDLVALRHLVQDFAHGAAGLLDDHQLLKVDDLVLNLEVAGLEGHGLAAGAVMLHKNVVADRVYESAQAVGFAQPTIRANRANDAGEGLLPQVLYGVRSQVARPELQLQEFGEIGNKMAFRRRVSFPEAGKIWLVKREKFQNLPRSAGKYSRRGEHWQWSGTSAVKQGKAR